VGRFYYWWLALSGGSKAAIIAAIVGPTVVSLLGLPEKMLRSFHLRSLRRLRKAEAEIRAYYNRPRGEGIINVSPDDSFPISLEQKAKKANMSLWRAKLAEKYQETFGS
jgi:hypothetical protein